jgi:hypothetical protein
MPPSKKKGKRGRKGKKGKRGRGQATIQAEPPVEAGHEVDAGWPPPPLNAVPGTGSGDEGDGPELRPLQLPARFGRLVLVATGRDARGRACFLCVAHADTGLQVLLPREVTREAGGRSGAPAYAHRGPTQHNWSLAPHMGVEGAAYAGGAWDELPSRAEVAEALAEALAGPQPASGGGADDERRLGAGWWRYPSQRAGWWLCARVVGGVVGGGGGGRGGVAAAAVTAAQCHLEVRCDPAAPSDGEADGWRMCFSGGGGCVAAGLSHGTHWLAAVPVGDLRSLIIANTAAALRQLVYYQAWDSLVALAPPTRNVLPSPSITAPGARLIDGRKPSGWLQALPVLRAEATPPLAPYAAAAAAAATPTKRGGVSSSSHSSSSSSSPHTPAMRMMSGGGGAGAVNSWEATPPAHTPPPPPMSRHYDIAEGVLTVR